MYVLKAPVPVPVPARATSSQTSSTSSASLEYRIPRAENFPPVRKGGGTERDGTGRRGGLGGQAHYPLLTLHRISGSLVLWFSGSLILCMSEVGRHCPLAVSCEYFLPARWVGPLGPSLSRCWAQCMNAPVVPGYCRTHALTLSPPLASPPLPSSPPERGRMLGVK